MGKRSRKRGVADTITREERLAAAAVPVKTSRPSRRAKLDELPPAPWSPFPLTELAILAGLIVIGVGFFAGDEPQVRVMVVGFVLVSLGAVEVAVREHFAGYRSHSMLIAGMLAAIVAALTTAAGLPPAAALPVAALVLAGAFWWMRRLFMERSGGLGFRA